jgi:murein DD-endopeptidase MepM/ murein hydrolase activator NlpD
VGPIASWEIPTDPWHSSNLSLKIEGAGAASARTRRNGAATTDDLTGEDLAGETLTDDDLASDDLASDDLASAGAADDDQADRSITGDGLTTAATTGGTSPSFTSGVFTALSSELSAEFQWDGGGYRGQVAIFALDGMDALTGDDFHREAARRASSASTLGQVIVDDRTEGAQFSGALPWESNFNQGEFGGVKTFAVDAGRRYGLMLVPNGTVADVLQAASISGTLRPLYSMATANPDGLFQAGQLVEAGSSATRGNTYIFEDQSLSGASDRDYNDIVVRLRGVSGYVPSLDEYLDPAKDWRKEPAGKLLWEDAAPYVTVEGEPSSASDPTVTTGSEGEPSPAEGTTSGLFAGATAPDTPASTRPFLNTIERFPAAAPASLAPIPLGIIDTGFAANHADLNYENITWGQDYIESDADPTLAPGEGNEHGTHLLGLMAALRDNDFGIDGIAPESPIWAARAVESGRWADALQDYVGYVRDRGDRGGIVTLSFDLTERRSDGTIATRYELTPAERIAIEAARQAGVLLVVAAGNQGEVMSALGQAAGEFDNIIAVGSMEQTDGTVAIADGGAATDYSSFGGSLTVTAVGGTVDEQVRSLAGDGLGEMAGTSVATAKVAAGLAQIWAANGTLNYLQVKEALTATATDLARPGPDALTGHGLMNLPAAIARSQLMTGETHTPAPWYAPDSWLGAGLLEPWERPASGGGSIATAPAQSPNFSDTSTVNTAQPEQYYKITLDRAGFLAWNLTRQGSSFPTIALVDANGSPAAYPFLSNPSGFGAASGLASGTLPQHKTDGWFADPGVYFVKVSQSDAAAPQPYELTTQFSADVVPNLGDQVSLFRTTPQTGNPTPLELFGGDTAATLNVSESLVFEPGGTTRSNLHYGFEVQAPVSLTVTLNGADTTSLRVEKLIGADGEFSAIEYRDATIPFGAGKTVTVNLNPGRYRLKVSDTKVETVAGLAASGLAIATTVVRPFGLSATATPLASAPPDLDVPGDAGPFLKTVTSSTGVVTHYFRNGSAIVQPSGAVSWYANAGTGMRMMHGSGLGVTTPVIPFNNQGDLNGDGAIDLITQRYSTPSGNQLSNQLDGTTALSSLSDLTTMLGSSVVGGVNGNGVPNVRLPDWRPVATGDFNNDNQLEVLWYKWRKNAPDDEDAGTLALAYFDPATATYNSKVIGKEPLEGNWRPAGTGDFNGDGKTDILWHKFGDGVGDYNTPGSAGMTAVWLLDTVQPDAAEPRILGKFALNGAPKLTDWQIGGTGDFNRDGISDILWQHPIDGRVAIWDMNSVTDVSAGPKGSIDLGLGRLMPDRRVAAIGNFDTDSDLEIIWRGSTSNSQDLVSWQMNGFDVESSGEIAHSATAPDWIPLGGLQSTVGFGGSRPYLFWDAYLQNNGLSSGLMPTSEVRRFLGARDPNTGAEVFDALSSMQWFETADRDEFLMINSDSREQAALLWGKRPSLEAAGYRSHADIYVERRGRGVNDVPLRQLLRNTYQDGDLFVSDFENGRIITHSDGRIEIRAWKLEHANLYVQRDGLGRNNIPLGKQLKDTYQDGDTFFTDFENGRIASHVDGRIEIVEANQFPSWIKTCSPFSSWTDEQWENAINDASDLSAINANYKGSELGKLYKSLLEDIFHSETFLSISGAFISDDYRTAVIAQEGRSFGFHGGIDIASPVGMTVHSLVDGVVKVVDRDKNGWLSIQGNDGRYYIYGHLSTINVSVGSTVSKGQLVGKSGNLMNGGECPAHLHFEVSKQQSGALTTGWEDSKEYFRRVSYNPLQAYSELEFSGASCHLGNFSDALAFSLKWEGGYVNDPDDPGGATNKGITQNVYNSFLTSQGLSGKDVALISDDEVRQIYYQNYWMPAGCDKLSERLAKCHFDASINHGLGKSPDFLEDAKLGVGSEDDQLKRYCNSRESYYRYLANNGMGKFLNGWLNRLNDLRGELGIL